jgi:hypothetical protein
MLFYSLALAVACAAAMPLVSIGKSPIEQPSIDSTWKKRLATIDGCSKSALHRILLSLHEEGALNIDLSKCSSIKGIKKRMAEPLADLRKLETPYGKLLQFMPTGMEAVPQIEICNPFAYLYHLSSIEPSFAKLLCDVTEGGNRQLRIVLYMDAINPGNPLRHDAGRNTECVYWTIAEFPDHVLTNASGWFVFSTIRSTVLEDWPGHYSGFMRKIVEHFWPNRQSPNFESGVLVPCIDRSLLVRCGLGGFLADEKAHKEVFGLKGAAGSKPCITCQNVIQFVDDAVIERSGTFWVGIDEIDNRKLRRCTSDTVYSIVDQLRAAFGTVTKAKFARMQQATGINYNPNGLLFIDNRLRRLVRPVEMCFRDPMHSLVSGGVAGTESARLIANLQEHGVTFEHLRRYVSAFTLPKAQGKVPAAVMAADKVGNDNLRCFAGELLTLVPLLLAFVEDYIVNRGIMLEHCRCYKLLAHILAICTCGPRGGAQRSRELGQSIIEHHTLYRKLYPEFIKPKFHHLLHLEENIDQIGLLLSCFVTERKHKSVKRAAYWTFSKYEHTLIADIVHRDIDRFRKDDLYLSERLVDPLEFAGYRTSLTVQLPCGEIHAGDLIAYRGKHVVQVHRLWCMPDNTDIVVQGQSLIATEIDNRWRKGGDVFIAPASGVVQALAWAPHGDWLRIVTPASGFGWE